VRFSIRFDEAGLIQPLEEHSCHYWCMDERVAYLCADGVTVRPIPGKEGVFDDFVQEFRRQNPELAENYRFAGPTE
jgi:hypothetical protein